MSEASIANAAQAAADMEDAVTALSTLEQKFAMAAAARFEDTEVQEVFEEKELQRAEQNTIYEVLTELDDNLVAAVERGDIRLVKRDWLLKQNRMLSRQELEKLEQQGRGSPLLSPAEAARLIRKGERSLGVLSYGWLTAGDPDPKGERLKILQRALRELPHIEAMFWDYGSLYQRPRTKPQNQAFGRALRVMGDLYASAIGTVVLQSSEIPGRPPEYDGCIQLFGQLHDGVKGTLKNRIRKDLKSLDFGENVLKKLVEFRSPGGGGAVAMLRFSSHDVALKVLEAIEATVPVLDIGKMSESDIRRMIGELNAKGLVHQVDVLAGLRRNELIERLVQVTAESSEPRWRHCSWGICTGAATVYNERLYLFRGWCNFEDCTSGEVVYRLEVVPKMQDFLRHMLAKQWIVSSTEPAKPVVRIQYPAPGGGTGLAMRLKDNMDRINCSIFTGKGDQDEVPKLYKGYVAQISTALLKCLAALRQKTNWAGRGPMLPPVPTCTAAGTAVSSVQFAHGLPVLTLRRDDPDRQAGGEGNLRVCIIGQSTKCIPLFGPDMEGEVVEYDTCSQAVLPYQRTFANTDLHTGQDWDLVADLMGPARTAVDLALELKTKYEVAIKQVLQQSQLMEDKAGLVQLMGQIIRDQTTASSETKYLVLRRLQKVLDPNRNMIRALRQVGALGARRYAVGQWLTVRSEQGDWQDAQVMQASQPEGTWKAKREGEAGGGDNGVTSWRGQVWKSFGTTCLRSTSLDTSLFRLMLHPWNHAPRDLQDTVFDHWCDWYKQTLVAKNDSIEDALSGRRLSTLDQCVAVRVIGAGVRQQERTNGILDVHGLASWLLSRHADLAAGLVKSSSKGQSNSILLTGPPAAGKTTLVRQLVVLMLQQAEVVPIVIKVQLLQVELLKHPRTFSSCWNWVDAYLQCVHGADSMLYRMLRQAMMARRVIVLLDGLDEGGQTRGQIERHLLEVLAPQGFVTLATSRPAGVDEAKFADVYKRVQLAPLSSAQQRHVLVKRLGLAQAGHLASYIEKFPKDSETGEDVTSNPLMLSMVATLSELREGLDMPETVAELYDTAAEVMMARGGVATEAVQMLLETVFFRGHIEEARVIEEIHLQTAALQLAAPKRLKHIETQIEAVVQAQLDKERIWAMYLRQARADEVRIKQQIELVVDIQTAFHEIPADSEYRRAIDMVLNLVRHDQLPLLSLLQLDPLRVQASHLTFQEHYTARMICRGAQLPAKMLPWRWPASWANVLRLGSEMGDEFGRGLLRATGLKLDGVEELDLKEKLGGHLPTSTAATDLFLAYVLETTQLSPNSLKNCEDAKGDLFCAAVAKHRPHIKSIDLARCNRVTDQGLAALSEGCTLLESINLIYCKNLTDCGLAKLSKGCSHLESINLHFCQKVTDQGLVELSKECPQLKSIDIRGCYGVTDQGLATLLAHCDQLRPDAVKSSKKAQGDLFRRAAAARSSSSY